jgi:hypothetical protein
MSAGRGVARVLLSVALAGPVLAGCGVDTQGEPERIPVGGIPAELRTTISEPAPSGP